MKPGFRATCIAVVTLVLAVGEVLAQAPHGFRVVKPKGAGPHPVAILLPGCSGFKFKGYDAAAAKLEKIGYASVHVDYVGRRTKAGNCVDAGISKFAANQDFKEVLAWLKKQKFADKRKVVAIGWSYGGGSLLNSLSLLAPDELMISKAIVYYPDCNGVSRWQSRLPLLILQAGADDVVSNENCRSLVAASDPEKSSTIVEFPGALHAFDMVDLPPRTTYPFGTIGHSPEATDAAWKHVDAFLAR